ncbi:MAG TPA: DUF883 family protein [Burkholderiales bacterium]|jgi:ElaB/YqjD/DUF883 family membrane-anchored ribosome-binding protein|nr:DUF883 family protein [Burkholderiales bacterium]
MEFATKREITTDKLMEDLRQVVSDAEELLNATGGQAGEMVDNARARAEESIRAAKVRIADAGHVAAEHTREAAKAANDYVRENPWAAVGRRPPALRWTRKVFRAAPAVVRMPRAGW